jgi:hypothetical protein
MARMVKESCVQRWKPAAKKLPNQPVVGQALRLPGQATRLPYNLFCAHIAAPPSVENADTFAHSKV